MINKNGRMDVIMFLNEDIDKMNIHIKFFMTIHNNTF